MELIYNKSYTEFEQELDTEINKTAESFVRIGYLLKVARDTDILKDSGYESVISFAKARYGLDKTQVSRFMHINDRFSENGYSECLQSKYSGIGYAKLTIMLQLPDEINEEITPNFTKTEIQTLKEEFEEENKKSDIEVLIEDEKETTKDIGDDLFKALIQLGEDEPELYCEIHKAAVDEGWSIDNIKAVMAPAGEKMYSIRIRGVGRMMLSLKDNETEIALVIIRTGEKIMYSWEDILDCLIGIIKVDCEAKESWKEYYGKEFPEKEEIALVQQPSQKKPEPKKQSKVSKAKTEKPQDAHKDKMEQPQQVISHDNFINEPKKVDEEDEILPEHKDEVNEVVANNADGCDGNCFYCDNEECNCYQEKRTKCTYDIERSCNIYEAHKVAIDLGVDCTSACCNRCSEDCGARCNYSAHGIKKEPEHVVGEIIEKTESETGENIALQNINLELDKLTINIRNGEWQQALMDAEELIFKIKHGPILWDEMEVEQ